jgi:hypothetical protein
MNKRRLVICLVALGAAVVVPRMLGAQEAATYPETQKLLMENAFVRVFEINVAAGVAEPRHSHARGLTIALSDYENETRQDGGEWRKGFTKFGDVRWAEPVTHEARNSGKTAQHVIRIELK